MRRYIVILACTFCSQAPWAFSASFDCSKASSKTEKTVCSDSRLGYLDQDLADVYQSLMGTFSGREKQKIKDEQIAWLKTRDDSCVDVSECKKIYNSRINHLRSVLESAIDLESFVIDRQSCRSSKNQEILIKCIESDAYDPCDDEGGKWGAAQCGWAHAKIAERRIKDKEDKIIEKMRHTVSGKHLIEEFIASSEVWEKYRDGYCDFANSVDDINSFSNRHLHLAYCIRRLNEERLEELNRVLPNPQ